MVNQAGQLITLPVELSRLSVPALANLRVVAPDEQAPVTLACGRGPVLTIDGQAYQTSVSGTLGELTQYFPLRVRLCTPGGTLAFGAGRHTLTAATPGDVRGHRPEPDRCGIGRCRAPGPRPPAR